MLLEGWSDQVFKDKILELIKNYNGDPFYVGFTLSEYPIFLGIGPGPCVAILVPTMEPSCPGLKSNLVSLKLNQKCRVYCDGKQIKSEGFDILQCNSVELAHLETFIMLSSAFISEMQNLLNPRQTLFTFFDSLLSLFKTQPAIDLTNERQGLWGELFVMYTLGKIKDLIKFWHKETTRKFDFSNKDKRIEVKTTTSKDRIHIFSHQQLFSNAGYDILIMSLMLRLEEAGLSLKELINFIRREIADDFENLKKLEISVRRAGMDDPNDMGPVYDEIEAKHNLAFFLAKNVPKFPLPEPTGVTGTRYNVDLSSAPRMGESELDNYILTFSN